MGKRYYCDYCDRTFIDDFESRKKHLKTIQHEKNRKLHYQSFRDLKTLVKEESAKKECKAMKNTGQCQFEASCNYTHFSKTELAMFAAQVAENESQMDTKTIDNWLKKRDDKNDKPTNFNLDSHPFQNYNFLAPSLQPPTIGQMCNTRFESWG